MNPHDLVLIVGLAIICIAWGLDLLASAMTTQTEADRRAIGSA